MRVKLLDERNRKMAVRIAEQGRLNSLFVAVGASHLSGKNGLIALLKQAEYQLEPINLETLTPQK
jgi:uncharacterized protein YbaP (TraB family)